MDWKISFVPSKEKYASAFCPPKVSCFKFCRCVSRASSGGRESGSSALTETVTDGDQ